MPDVGLSGASAFFGFCHDRVVSLLSHCSEVALRGFCRGDTGFLVSEQGVVVLRPNSGLAQTESVPLPIGLQVEVLDVAMQDGLWKVAD